jgi:hypothetical protein
LFKPDIGEVPDVGGVRIVAVAEHGDIEKLSTTLRWKKSLGSMPSPAFARAGP